jgi:hypothetical protein
MHHTSLSRKGKNMRKKHLVSMINFSANTLHDIKSSLMTLITDAGGKCIDHGTDDRDHTCFILKGKTIGISTHAWDVDCKTVPFPEFLKVVINLCSTTAPNYNKILIHDDDVDDNVHIIDDNNSSLTLCGERLQPISSTHISNAKIPVTCECCLAFANRKWGK